MKTMSGRNKLVLCEAELMRILEDYLNTDLFGVIKVKVSGVKYLSIGNYTNSFEVTLEEYYQEPVGPSEGR